MEKDKLIQTGKVLVTCTLTIIELGRHAGSGEDWADEENAMTAAEAQAFKRACSCFGLGRYLYNFTEMWVPLNEHRQPVEFPALPQWALPKTNEQEAKSTPPAVHGLQRYNVVPSTRRRQRELRDFGAFWVTRSTERSFVVSRVHRSERHSKRPAPSQCGRGDGTGLTRVQ